MPIARDLLAELDYECSLTRKTIALVPETKTGWRPHAKSSTIGELAAHLASLPNWVARTLDTSEFDLAPILGKTFSVPAGSGTADFLARFDANWKAARESIAKASDEHLTQPWTLKHGGKVLATLPRVAALRSFVVSHSIHHRGQMTVYLRLLDVPLPAIYGPTADTPL